VVPVEDARQSAQARVTFFKGYRQAVTNQLSAFVLALISDWLIHRLLA